MRPALSALRLPQDRRDANPAYRFLRLLCLTDGARRILPDDSAAFLLNHTRWVLWAGRLAGWRQLRGGESGLGCALCCTNQVRAMHGHASGLSALMPPPASSLSTHEHSPAWPLCLERAPVLLLAQPHEPPPSPPTPPPVGSCVSGCCW